MDAHGLPCRFAIRGKRLPAAARSSGEKAGFPESLKPVFKCPVCICLWLFLNKAASSPGHSWR